MQATLLLVAPALFAATIYMELGRIIAMVDGEGHVKIPLRWLTKIFVIGDVFSFMLQGAGKRDTLRLDVSALTMGYRSWSTSWWFTRSPGQRIQDRRRRSLRPAHLLRRLHGHGSVIRSIHPKSSYRSLTRRGALEEAHDGSIHRQRLHYGSVSFQGHRVHTGFRRLSPQP